MRRSLVVLALLATVAAAGCTAPATPTPSPTSIEPTSTPLGPATCYPAPLTLTEVTVPPITDADHSHGPAEADIVVIEYADFQ